MVLETRVTRGPRNHLVMVFRQVREDLAPEARSAHLLNAFDSERRLYPQVFNSLPTPALVLTADGQILEANPEGIRLLGASDPLALRGRTLVEWAPVPQRTALAAGLRDAVTRRQEFHLALEVSREMLLQRRLLQADRLSQLGALVSGVAHELNNPLAAIAAFAELLAGDPHQADVKEDRKSTRLNSS